MFKLPSLNTLTESFLKTIVRYNWVVFIALLKLILLIWYIETPHSDTITRNLLTRLSYVSFLSLPLFLAVLLIAERYHWKNRLKYGILAFITGLLGVYYFYINQNPNQTDFYRFLLFMAGAHLAVSFSPFVKQNEPNGFWQFNKTLFLQFLNATLYSTTLYLGLLIAVETVKFLFKIEFSFEIEMDLLLIIFILFHTVFFLSKIPENVKALDNQTDYPTGLKIFTQYVLLPLEVVYLVILYAYTARIIFQWQLPDGGVAYLVLAFSTAGILALLLLYPLRENLKERWISIFSQRFYFALLPLIVLLGIGIFRRINDYGLTENRYLVAVLAIWLAGITIYFLAAKRSDIRWIPISLSVISFLIAIGPWNLFTLAEKSQLRLFNEILSEHKLLNAKNKITGKAILSKQKYNQLFSIVDFFKVRDKTAIAKYFLKLPADPNEGRYSNVMNDYLRKYVSFNGANSKDEFKNYSFYKATDKNISIEGFNQMMTFNASDQDSGTNQSWQIKTEENEKIMTVYLNNEKVASWDLSTKITELVAEYGNQSDSVSPQHLSFEHTDAKNHVKVTLTDLSWNNRSYYYSGILFYR